CFTKLKSLPCDADIDSITECRADNARDALEVRGTLLDGAPCIITSQCMGQCNRSSQLAQCGICGAEAAAGGACPGGNDKECRRGWVCEELSRTCVRPQKLGEECGGSKTQDCETGARCDVGGQSPWRCVALGRPGDACQYDAQCAGAQACRDK